MTAHQNIDWNEVRNRLATQEAALEHAEEHSIARVQAAHRHRAQELASRRAAASTQDKSWSGLICLLGCERFCLPLTGLIEVLPFARCTPTPGGPPELCGVVHIRGEVCSVLDLAQLLQLPADSERPLGYIVLVRCSGAEVGLRVDGLEKIEIISPELLTAIDGEIAIDRRAVRARTANRATVLNVEELLARCNC